MTLVGYKGRPQGSVLSPFLNNIIGSCADRFIPSGCGRTMGLTISGSKSEVMLFTRKHERLPILVRVGSNVLPQTTCFKYLGIFFDAGLRWNCHAKYVRRRCLQRVNLLKLMKLNMGRCNRGYSDVLSLDIVPSESFTQHKLPALLGTPLVDEHMEKKLANIQGAMYSLVAPRELMLVTSEYGASCIFYTDGSLIEGCVSFAVHQMGVSEFGHKIPSPAGVFTVELSTLFTALRHIAEVIRPSERCLILTDSLSSIKAMLSRKIAHQTHPLVYECKQLCWSLCHNAIEVKLMYIPSHVGLVRNEIVDEWARQAAL
jgi:ribonuclease HI